MHRLQKDVVDDPGIALLIQAIAEKESGPILWSPIDADIFNIKCLEYKMPK